MLLGGAIAAVLRRLGKLVNLVALIKYELLFSALLFYLPFATFPGLPLHGMLGNLFSELTPLSAFWTALFAFAGAWFLMGVEGLIVNGVEVRWRRGAQRAYRSLAAIQAAPSPDLPAWADRLFSVPVTRGQFVLFTVALAGPAAVVVVHEGADGSRALDLVAVVAGLVVAYALMLLAAAPAAVLDPADPPFHGLFGAQWLWRQCSRHRWFVSASSAARALLTAIARTVGMGYLVGPDGVYPAHVFAVVATLIFGCAAAFVSVVFYPARLEAAAAVYLYISLLLFIGVFGFLSFHFGRIHVSPLIVLGLVIVTGYGVRGLDHYYRVRFPPRTEAPVVDPIDVARTAGDNLVVVTSAGGGIWAAGWTTVALEQLIAARPQLLHEIRLLSTISGGSVGAAYFVDGLLRAGPGAPSPRALHDVTVKATSSSLDAVAYGFAFRDFPQLLTGGWYRAGPRGRDRDRPGRDAGQDRGTLLEQEWSSIAAGEVAGDTLARKGPAHEGRRPLRSLARPILAGSVPAVIFGSTVMETGRRVMITPVTFDGGERAATLPEFLFGRGSAAAARGVDIDLWTAARLSATFTYVSPPVRLPDTQVTRASQRQHLIDGGYYDNFGVTSALDWLDPVLRARARGTPGLRFKRVAIVQLVGWAHGDVAQVAPANGLAAALTGPTLTAFLAIREGVAASRDSIDLDRITRSWNARLSAVEVRTFTFAPDRQPPGPLSWQLSSRQIRDLRCSWSTVLDPPAEWARPRNWRPNIRDEWRRLEAFLDGDRSVPDAPAAPTAPAC